MSKASNPCTYIDGIGSSQAIDTAGEIVDLKGLDISSLVSAAFNWEHKKDEPSQIVGKILEAKKIFSKEDCENDRHLFYWEKCQIPFLYVMGRLFDDKKPSSVEVAALFKDDAEHPHEADMVGFSIEGAKVEKVGAVVTRSIARKCTITHIPANKQCIAEMLPVAKAKKNDDISSLFKGEMELFKFEPTYQEIMEKKEEDLKKGSPINPIAVAAGKAAFGGSTDSAPSPSPSPTPAPTTSSASSSPINPIMVNAGKAAFGKSEKSLKKALEAGSGMAAPSQLTQGAALAKEDMGKKLHKKEKTKHFERADQAYQNWSDREKFRGYMKKRMPHLADGEIDAFGRVLALKKDMDKEKSLSKMYSSYFHKTETGHEKGVHTQSPTDKPGVSAMGQQVRRAKEFSDKTQYPKQFTNWKSNFTAKMHSENKLNEASKLPKPNLKSEDIEKTTDIMMASEKNNKKQ